MTQMMRRQVCVLALVSGLTQAGVINVPGNPTYTIIDATGISNNKTLQQEIKK